MMVGQHLCQMKYAGAEDGLRFISHSDLDLQAVYIAAFTEPVTLFV